MRRRPPGAAASAGSEATLSALAGMAGAASAWTCLAEAGLDAQRLEQGWA